MLLNQMQLESDVQDDWEEYLPEQEVRHWSLITEQMEGGQADELYVLQRSMQGGLPPTDSHVGSAAHAAGSFWYAAEQLILQ